MSLFAKLFGSEKTQKNNAAYESKNESAVSLNIKEKADDGEIVAVIMAALMNMLSDRAKGGLQIKSIRRVGRNSPVWNLAGRDEYITSKL
jgi:hypothetical protein